MKASTDSTVKRQTDAVPGEKASGEKVPGAKTPGEKAPGAKTPGTKASGTKTSKKAKNRKGWLDTAKVLDQTHPRLAFFMRVAGYYFLMLALFLYFMLANLSTAPKFVYTQF